MTWSGPTASAHRWATATRSLLPPERLARRHHPADPRRDRVDELLPGPLLAALHDLLPRGRDHPHEVAGREHDPDVGRGEVLDHPAGLLGRWPRRSPRTSRPRSGRRTRASRRAAGARRRPGSGRPRRSGRPMITLPARTCSPMPLRARDQHAARAQRGAAVDQPALEVGGAGLEAADVQVAGGRHPLRIGSCSVSLVEVRAPSSGQASNQGPRSGCRRPAVGYQVAGGEEQERQRREEVPGGRPRSGAARRNCRCGCSCRAFDHRVVSIGSLLC